ncbi:nephrin [Eurytemora carolleeae]|uniref:nephrin n=1 Tax=Eurytemora carolleeae TaxID=1294199 RepID=UPI000C78A7B3|nr:nephrin [Eurytemora carolleeae]|eukprot:XP_023334724.1 nephrin-like [Eurytemora affinis]
MSKAVESVLIVDEEGKDRSTFVGPYLQGQSVKLKCIAVKGHPSPKVEWFRNRESLGSSWVILENRTVVSELEIHNLSRSDLHSELSCRVSNNNISAPTTITVHVDMNFSPSSVRLEGGDDEMIVGKTYTVTCIIEGSRPPPVVTWFINSKRIEGVQDTSTGDGTLSRSKLNFNPGVEDVDKVLLCKAFNPVVLGSEPVSSEISLNISYAPRVLIGLGKSISPNTVYEGGDVYFDCKVQALPPSTRISWIHNGVELRQDVENGILFTNYSLVLQKITRELSGSYSCEAWSRVGRGQSQELLLDVKYVPVCKSVQPMIYGVSKRELVNVLCEVEANPADVEFRWTFNNSAELIKVPTGRPENNFSTSLLSYTPVTAMDYGTLMCSSRNQVGHQKLPCVYHIIMAVTPDPVENCTVINKSSESFHLQCLPGFDGGMNQTFHITVKERENGIVMYDDSNLLKPDVNIQHLKPGGNYLVSVTSYNKKGTSQPNHIDIETMQPPESQQVEVFPVEEEKDVSWQVGAGVIAGIFLCIMVATVLILSVQRHCRKPSQGDTRLILDTAETHLASSSTCSNIIICSSPSHPNLHRTDCTLIRERFCNSRDPGELGLSPSRSLISEENASGQTIQRCRKGILKRNQDCDSSRQDQATCIRQDQATTNIMEDPLYTVESLSLQPRAGSRNTRTPEIRTYI